MSRTEKRRSTAGSWERYVPSKEAPWDLRRVVHLHRGAGFAATWKELQRDLEDGPGPAVERLLKGKARSEGVPDDFVRHAARLARLAVGTVTWAVSRPGGSTVCSWDPIHSPSG
jgi:hypothetical protein